VSLPIQKSAGKTASLSIQKSATKTVLPPIQKSTMKIVSLPMQKSTAKTVIDSENSVAVDPKMGSDGGVVWTFIFFGCLHSPSLNMNFLLEI